MKTKQWIGILLTIVLMFSLASCGTKNREETATENTSDITAQAAEPDNDEKGSQESEERSSGDGNILVVYFSYTGHLDSMAHWIADETGGDLIRVTAKEAYSDDYDETVDRAKKEQDEDARPQINAELTQEQLAGYDTVFFGFPVWWYDIPMPMYTFLDTYNFSGKTIIPFFSHEGSSNGASAKETIEQQAAGADVRFDDALSIRGGEVDSSEQDVREWVINLGFGK
jgi:flavodoxin